MKERDIALNIINAIHLKHHEVLIKVGDNNQIIYANNFLGTSGED